MSLHTCVSLCVLPPLKLSLVAALMVLTACEVGIPAKDSSDTGTDSGDTQDSQDSEDTQDSSDTSDTSDDRCVPNGDWRIDFSEFVADPTLGLVAASTVNEPGSTVEIPDQDGVDDGAGGRTWDFSEATSEDRLWDIGLSELEGFWFADEFPDATYTVPLDASEESYGIYKVDADAEKLLLLGMASATQDFTLLKYASPISVFEFPIRTDRSWASVDVEASGTFEGESYPIDYGLYGVVSLQHTYTMSVDLQGSAKVPLGTYDVLRLKLEQSFKAVNSISGPFAENTQISYFYVTECTGLVARVRGVQDETDPDFHLASEYLRLGN